MALADIGIGNVVLFKNGGKTVTPEEKLFDELKEQIGQEVAVTDWFSIDQENADTFGNMTDDWDPMHNDPEWGRKGPWGGTIAHGYHVLAMTSSFLKHAVGLPVLTNERFYALNYGLDRVRFISPLRIGKRARSHVVLKEVREKRPREYLVKTEHTVEIEGEERPFMVAECISLYVAHELAA